MKVNLGGDRIGSGNKMQVRLRNYNRSTHNLSQSFISSMAPGILYPFLVVPAMRGDSFEINLSADAMTIPTNGPLFGSFKMQVDLYQCPVRLYQAILHNNPTAIGLKMNEVKFPSITIQTKDIVVEGSGGRFSHDENQSKFNESSLLKYLGLSGLGHFARQDETETHFERTFPNAVPILAYYDIFKNYYANKQEEDAYVCTAAPSSTTSKGVINYVNVFTAQEESRMVYPADDGIIYIDTEIGQDINNFYANGNAPAQNIEINYTDNISGDDYIKTLAEMKELGLVKYGYTIAGEPEYEGVVQIVKNIHINTIEVVSNVLLPTQSELKLKPFKLKNIDDMRMEILSHHELGVPFNIGAGGDWDTESGTDQSGLPYSTLIDQYSDGTTYNKLSHNGLVVKTYQSDIFNNWVKTEWIDGENGISEITKVAVTDGAFKIDALNLAEKMYNMLNRVAVADGTYEGWQDATYTQSPRRHIESPVYLGGMSNEIIFQQIVQQTPAEINGEQTPLGTLGGKGKMVHRKGGYVRVKIDEASFIIGIVSITPRLVYTQGNEWYMTELSSMDDWHKPALDGIGFQDLIGEQMLYSDTRVDMNGEIVGRSKIGKLPAWINYMTAVDKAYGDFAKTDGKAFMVLGRNYSSINGRITDATTYVDPTKFNYAFAATGLDAQNFWVQIYSDIKARRLMSAKQIPNL